MAEAVTETGVTLRGESAWEPANWDQEPLRREAIRRCRATFKQTDRLNVKVGPIRVFRERRWAETVTTTYRQQKFDSEVSRWEAS